MTAIETEYQSRMSNLQGTQRVARAMGMLRWTREMLARQIVAEHGEMSDERLKLQVAMRLYGADDRTRKLIERRLADVPR